MLLEFKYYVKMDDLDTFQNVWYYKGKPFYLKGCRVLFYIVECECLCRYIITCLFIYFIKSELKWIQNRQTSYSWVTYMGNKRWKHCIEQVLNMFMCMFFSNTCMKQSWTLSKYLFEMTGLMIQDTLRSCNGLSFWNCPRLSHFSFKQ